MLHHVFLSIQFSRGASIWFGKNLLGFCRTNWGTSGTGIGRIRMAAAALTTLQCYSAAYNLCLNRFQVRMAVLTDLK